jgi:MtaA/CmuA family methyltransferase
MTGRERVLAALHHEPVDRLPFMPITMMFAADTAGVKYGAYARDHRVMVEAQVQVADRYGIDHVSAISDPAREASDLGARIEWFEDQPPAIVESQALLADKAALARLTVPDPLSAPRMRDRVEALRLLKERRGTTHAVEGWVEGPCAMAADLRGVNTLMLDFVDDPEFVEQLFAFVVEMEIAFAKAQVDAGADYIGIGDAAASLIGPRLYHQFVEPWEIRLIEAIHQLGVPVRLHICGNTRRIAAGMGRTGADMIDLDFPVPVVEARALIPSSVPLCGNLDPVRAVRDGSPETITAALDSCYAAAGASYIVGAGCEIARGTPPGNLQAMAEFARTHIPHP